MREKLEQQNELLRAILASSVDAQEDARSTAQNSRTFAWAGAAIALLTLIATVIAIVAADDADRALDAVRSVTGGEGACLIGEVRAVADRAAQ